MSWIKSNAVPLLIGAAVGYYVAKAGGLKGAVGGTAGKLKAATG
jgi:hypothetical protein